jgi:carboxymethylenebutenolidase
MIAAQQSAASLLERVYAKDGHPMVEQELTAPQRALVETWERHMAAEFDARSIEATMATMTADPVVNHVPVMTGGVGAREVRHFYTEYFIGRHPPDVVIVPLTRTVGPTRIVDELLYQFTHTIEMPWMLPGIAPTGRHVAVALVVVVDFVDGKISGERIYWDQASVLAQLGALAVEHLPVTGIEAARKVRDPAQEPSNALIARTSGPRG